MNEPYGSFRRELRRWHKDRRGKLLLLWLPIISCLLLLAIFKLRVIIDLPVGVIDLDQSSMSRQIIAQIDATPAIRVQRYLVSTEAAREAVERGEIYAVVEFPAHFRRDVMRGRQPKIGLLLNEQSLAAAGAINPAIKKVVLSAAGENSVMVRAASGMPLLEAMALAQPIRVQSHPLFNPGLDYAAYLGIALIAASLQCFVILHGARCITSESKDWLQTSGWAKAAGKYLAGFLWWWLLGSALLFGSFAWLDLPPVSEPLWYLAGWGVLVVAYISLGAALAMTFPSHVAYSCVSVVAGPAVAFSGVTFPQGAMPTLPRLFGEALPLTRFLHLQTELVTEQLTIAFVLPELVHLAVLAGLFSLFAVLAFFWHWRNSKREPI